MNEVKETINLKRTLELFEIPRSSFYERINREESHRDRENRRLLKKIKQIWELSNRVYGAPKIHSLLIIHENEDCSLKRVQKLMKENHIRSITQKKWRPQGSSTPIPDDRENLLKQDFTTTGINQVWVTDITYIWTGRDEWSYLSTILDLHSRKAIWSFGQQMTVDLVLDTLTKAIQRYGRNEGLILHSDLGSQYTSEEYEKALEKYGILHSFSRKANPYDNAVMESFHSILKKEEVYQKNYPDYQTAHRELFQYIEAFYNRKRVHSALGNRTPLDVENQYLDQSII